MKEEQKTMKYYTHILVLYINHDTEDSKTVIIPSNQKLSLNVIENRINSAFYGYKVLSFDILK
jgi:hypothetical protein